MTQRFYLGRRAALAGVGTMLLVRGARADGPSDAMVAAARKEGTVVFHTSIDLPVAQKMVSAFQAAYPGVKVQLERSGAERVLQRITQEYSSGIKAADVVESSDASMFVDWKQKGWLASYTPDAVARFWPKEEHDPDGCYAGVRATLSVIAYNTKQVKPEDAPKSFQDLLVPKWRMRMVKGHPGYSGTILTSTFATVHALGWAYMEQVAKQKILQTQSAADPPKKVAQGERSVQFDGAEYTATYLRDAGNPIELVYAPEGSPLITGHAGILKEAPHPNASRLFMEFIYGGACQQIMSDEGGIRSVYPDVKLPKGRLPLSEIKLLHTDPVQLVAEAEEIKRRYSEIFGI